MVRLGNVNVHQGHERTGRGDAVQPLFGCLDTGNSAPGTGSGEAIKDHGGVEPEAFGLRHEARMDGTGIPSEPGPALGHVVLRPCGRVCLPRAGGTVRKLETPPGGHPGCPVCLLCSIIGVQIAGIEVTVFTQIGFVVLVGLACKNAILIVEFAKQKTGGWQTSPRSDYRSRRLRLRPIVMTSFAFIFGVLPLVYAQGAGSEMRRSLGVAVFAGMLGVTAFGIFLTPVFYSVIQRFGATSSRVSPPGPEKGRSGEANPRPPCRESQRAAHKDGVASPEEAVSVNGKITRRRDSGIVAGH